MPLSGRSDACRVTLHGPVDAGDESSKAWPLRHDIDEVLPACPAQQTVLCRLGETATAFATASPPVTSSCVFSADGAGANSVHVIGDADQAHLVSSFLTWQHVPAIAEWPYGVLHFPQQGLI